MSNYKKISASIEQITINNPTTTNNKLKWINIVNPRKKEINYLRKKFKFNLNNLHSSSAKVTAQRPFVEKNEKHLFIILHFPTFKNKNIVANEIEFFLGQNYLITLHNNNNPTLNQFFNICKKDSEALLSYKTGSSFILLYELLEKLLFDCFTIIDKNSIAINKVEDMIFGQHQKKATTQILLLRRNLINIRKIMQNHKNIIKKLMQMKNNIVPEERIKKYYIRLIEHSKRIWEYLENQKEMVEALHDTNESILNYKISNIMKTLTIFSVIVFPLTLFAAIFGMNITNGMPLINTTNGFWFLILIMLIGSLFMLLFFKKKKWL